MLDVVGLWSEQPRQTQRSEAVASSAMCAALLVSSGSSLRHTGHWLWCSSQGTTQSGWKLCVQSSSIISAPRSKSSRQMAQAPSAAPLESELHCRRSSRFTASGAVGLSLTTGFRNVASVGSTTRSDVSIGPIAEARPVDPPGTGAAAVAAAAAAARSSSSVAASSAPVSPRVQRPASRRTPQQLQWSPLITPVSPDSGADQPVFPCAQTWMPSSSAPSLQQLRWWRLLPRNSPECPSSKLAGVATVRALCPCAAADAQS